MTGSMRTDATLWRAGFSRRGDLSPLAAFPAVGPFLRKCSGAEAPRRLKPALQGVVRMPGSADD
jgi:hypothetical protein